jgi:hypothetical protein
MRKNRVLIITASLTIGFVLAVAITDLLDKVIWPSLFVGVPAGVIASAVSYLILRRATGANLT